MLKFEGPLPDLVNMTSVQQLMETYKILTLYEQNGIQITMNKIERVILPFYTLKGMWTYHVSQRFLYYFFRNENE